MLVAFLKVSVLLLSVLVAATLSNVLAAGQPLL